MPIRRAKSLQALYDDVRAYDRVLVPDAPLASALNRQLDRAQLGEFATTPRRLAAGRREEGEERTVFLELVRETDLSWKEAAHVGEEIIHCWEYTGRPDAILEYDRYDRPDVARAVEHVRGLDTTSRHLTEYAVDPSVDLAVVGYPQLSALERSILPDDYDMVSRFADAALEAPDVHLFDTAADIVDAVLDPLTQENADDVAVVLDAGSEFSALVEAALDAADVPYFGGPGFLDDPDRRAFLGLLRAAFRGREVRVGDVAPLLRHVGVDLAVDHEDKRLHALDAPGAERFREWCRAVAGGEFTFGAAVVEYRSMLGGEDLEALREELATLGLAERTVTESAVDDLAFYLQSYEVPLDRENRGVLLADATAATHVDRPLVFYLGLDDGWTRTPPRRPWVDREAEFDRHLRQFQLLLQNGTARYYLVRDTVGGSPVTPCLYLAELLDEPFDRFGDLDATRCVGPPRERDAGFDAEPMAVEPTRLSTVSQSSLGTYVNSPRDYFFGRLVDAPDRDYLREGGLFHDFAEYYVHHPGTVSEDTVEEVVDVMLAEMAPFVRDVDRPVRRTRYRAGVHNIVAFLDEHAPEADAMGLGGGRTRGNTFADHFGRPVGSDVAERWFEDETLGVKGKIDLVASPTRLVDYKSGARSSAAQVVADSALEDVSDTPNFQALLYLTHQRHQRPGEELEFVFVHFLENLDDVVRGDSDLEDTLTTVTYHPTPYAEYVRREATFERLRDDGAGDCRRTLSKASYGAYDAAFEDADLPETRDSDELIESAFGRAFVARMKEAVGDYRYVETGCEQAMRELARIRSRNYFPGDLDAFETFVDKRLAELNERRAGGERFPVADLLDEPNYRRVDHRDLILEGDR